MSIQEQRRAAFEDWYVASALANCPELTEDHTRDAVKHYRGEGDYAGNSSMRDAWWGWSAALDSVVIELPDSSEVVGDYSREVYRHARDEFIEAIEAAGLKVAP